MDTTSFSEIAALDEFKNLPKEEKLKATQKYWDEFAASDPANIDNALKLKEFATQYVEADDLVKDAASVEARMAKVDRDVYAFKMTMGEASLRGEITPEEYEAESTTFEEELKARQEQVNKAYEIDRPENRGVVTAAAKAALEAGVFGEQALRPALGMSFPGAPIPTTTDADVALRQRYDKARSILSEQFNLEPEEADDLVKHQLGLQKDPVSRDAFGVIHFKDDLLARSTADIEAAVKESSLPERVKARTIDGLGDRVQNYKKGIVNEAAQYHKELAADIKLDPEGDPDKEYKKITDVLQKTRLAQTGGGVLGYALGRLGGFGSTFAAAPGYVATPMGGVTVTPPIEGKELEQVRESMKAPAKKQESINALSDRINQEKVRILGTNAAVVGQGIGSAIESIAIGALTGGVGTALISADRIAKAGKFGQVALGFGQRALNTAPVAGYFGAGQALDTYESAVKAGKPPMEAAKLAATSGAVEFGVTTLFGGMKLGGLEDIRLRFANPEVRRQLAKTVARSWREFGFGTAKGMVGEISEELSITALDSVLVQAEINPNMTVEDFKKSLTDTLVATAFSSGPLTTLSEAREQGRGLLRATQGEFTPVDVTPAERRADELLDSAEQAAPEAAAAARSVLDAQGQPISSAPPVLPPPTGFETTPPPAGFETTPPPDVARDQRDSAILSRVTPEEARLGGLPARVLGREEFSIQRPQRGLLGIRRDPETLGGRMDFFFESREAAQPLLDQLTRAGFSNGINNIGGGLVWVNAKDISGGTQNLENFLGLAKTPTVTPSISPTPPDVTALPTQEVIPEVPVAQGNVPPPSLEGVGEVAEAAPPVPVEGTPAVAAPVTYDAEEAKKRGLRKFKFRTRDASGNMVVEDIYAVDSDSAFFHLKNRPDITLEGLIEVFETAQAQPITLPAPVQAATDSWDLANRSRRGSEWQEGSISIEAREGFNRANQEGGNTLQSHGMGKARTLGSGLKDLLGILTNGIDPNRGGGQLYTAQLTKAKGQTGVQGATASGTSYQDGPFILVQNAEASKVGLGIRDSSEIAAVLVNEANLGQLDAIREAINAVRPDIVVVPYSQADVAVKAIVQKATTPEALAPAPLTPGQPVNVTLDDGTTAPGSFRGYDSSGNPQVSTLADPETVLTRRNAQVTPISPTPTPTPTPTPQPDATQERSIEESSQPERQDADEGGTPTETSGGDLTELSREEQKEDEVTAETPAPATSRTLTTPIYGTADSKVVGYSWDENGNVSFTVQDGLGNETQVSRDQLQDTLKPKTSAAKAALGEFARKAKRNAVNLSRGENQYFTDEEVETTGQEASTEADTPQTIIAKAKKDIRELADQINTFNQAATKAFNRGAFDDQKQLLGLAEEARIELTRLRKNLAEYEQDNPTAPAPPMSKVARAIYAKVRDNDSFPVINALFGKNIKRKALNEKLTGYDGYIPIDGLKSVGSPAGNSAAKELLRGIYSRNTRDGVSPDQAVTDELSGEPNNILTADEMWAALSKELSRVAKGDVTNENDQDAWMEENGATIEAENAKIADQNQKFSDAVEYGQESVDLETLSVGDRLMINGIMVEVTSVNTDKTGFSDDLESIDIDGGLDFGVQRVSADQDLKIDIGGFITKERYEAGAFSEEFKTAQDSQEADRVRDEYLDQMAENIRATNEEERNTSPISLANGETLGEPLEYNEENRAAYEAIEGELERTKFMARMMVSMLEKAREVKGTEEIDYTVPEEFNENEYFSLQEGIANPLLEQAGGVVPPPSPRRQFGLLYDAAMAAEVAWKTSKKDGTAGTRLLNSLIEGKDPLRVLRDIEIAHLTLEGVARRDAVNFRSQQLANLLNNPREGQAYKDELAEAEINLAEASAKYQEILMYAASARSQSGRSLNAWKFAIKDDYSYASVSAREGTVRLAARRKVDPNATFKFSEEELAELRAYSESQLALQDLLKLKTDARTLSGKDRAAWVENESDAANTIRQLQETILRMEAEKAKGPRNVKGLKKAQESLKAKAELARQRRASKKGVYLNAGFFIDQDTAEAIEDYAIIGADWFFNNALMTLGEFAARLKKEGSQLADTFVDRIYAGAKKNYNREIREFAAQEGRSSEDIIAELDADDTPTRGMVFDLARAFIREGQRDFEVLNSVAAAMSGPFPDLSREDVAILFTNYGKGESVVAPELQAALLTATNLERDTLKLGSLQRGEAPKRSQDMVQREITPKLLDLRTKIQNLQKKMKYDQRDESQELASAHSKSRNRMRNIIAAKRKAVKEGIALESNRMGDKGDLPAENLALQAELDLINEEYNAAFGALTPEEMERRRKLSAHNTAEKWIGRMTETASDTLKWDVKPGQEPNLQKLITDHVREANPDFQAQAVAFGVTEEQARVMDALANHERKSRETFKETKKKLRKEEVAEREAARRRPEAVADALIKRFSERMLDSSQLKRDSKPTSEVTLLTRSHLKEAIPDFVDVMVGLGATRDQAETLNGLINAEREKIASLKPISVTDRNAILEKSLDRQIQAEQDLINQGLVRAITNGEKNPAETEAVLSRRKALKELRLLKYELYEAANPGQLATNQAFKDVNDAITRRQKTLAELESGLVTEKKEKKDRTEGVNVTQELQDQWDTSDRLDVLITSLRREKAKLPDTPSQTARKIEASLKLAESALARNEKRIANNDILPRATTESPASKDARVKEVRGRNKELLNLIVEMQREQQIGSFSPAARLARQLGTSQKILDELNEANRTGVYPKKKERPKPLDDRDLDMIRFKIDRARELRDANLAQQLWNETRGWRRRKEQLIALLRFRQMFSLTGDVGNPSRQLGPARLKFLRNDILKLITAAWNPATRQDIRENGLITQRWLTAIARAAKSDEVEFESYSKFLNHPDYMRRAKLGFQLLRPGEFSAELGKGDTARLNPMNLFPWWAIGVAATIKATLRASIQAMNPADNVSIFDFASTVAVGFGALKAAKVLERMNRVALNVGRWEVQNLMDQKSLAENYFGWERHEEYEKDMIRVTNTFSGRGTLEGQNIGPAFEGAVNLLSIVSDHPRWRLSRIMVAFGQPLFQLKFGGPKEKRAAAYKVAENYFDMFAGAALNMYLTYLVFGLTPMTSIIMGLVSGKGDEDDEEENRKKRERIEKLTYPVSHYLDPKFGAMRVGDVYFDDLSGATKYLSFLMRVLSDTKLDPAAREQGINREIPIEAYDKRKMISDFLAGHLNRNAQFGIEALVMGEYRTGGPVGDLPLGTAVLATMDAFTVNATLRDMGKIYDKLGDVDGTIAIAQLLGGIGVSPAETGRERDIRIAKERRLAAEEARRRRQAE